MNRGYIKVFRKLKEWGFYRDSRHVHLWTHLLLSATHKPIKVFWNGEMITLQPGQLITGRKRLATETGLRESFIYRAIKCYESEQQIEQQPSNTSTLITIRNWHLYAGDEQLNEQQMNNKRTTSEQPVNTKQEVKNEKNEENKDLLKALKPLMEKIDNHFPNFNPYQFMTQKTNKQKRPLECWVDLWVRMVDEIDNIEKPWAWCERVFAVEAQNVEAHLNEQEHEKRKVFDLDKIGKTL